jgi:hypothetical protein
MEKIIKAILEALLSFFWPKLVAPKEAEDGEPVGSREEKLREKIKERHEVEASDLDISHALVGRRVYDKNSVRS